MDIRLEIVYRKVSDLIPYVRNSRKHDDEQVNIIAASIKEFGFNDPIGIDGDKGIIEGHGRLKAAMKLGYEEVPTVELSHLTETQKKAYIIAHNKVALRSTWDLEMLKLEMQELNDAGLDMSLTGFDLKELKELLTFNASEAGLTDDDATPEVQQVSYSQIGDLWIMGEHRLLCGDSTKMENIQRLMNGHQADLIFTDPPYGMSYEGGRGKKKMGMIKNDDKTGESLIGMVQDALAGAIAATKRGASAYICFTWRTYSEFEQAIKRVGLQVANCIVWDKKMVGLGYANYRPQHEFIFYCKGEFWNGDKAQSDVWSMSRDNTQGYKHPNQKPVELIERALNNSSKGGDLVLDVFGGSGSTLIGCHKTGRKGHLMELDPKYIDVIVRRWQDYSGKKAVLDGDGRDFETVMAERRKADG